MTARECGVVDGGESGLREDQGPPLRFVRSRIVDRGCGPVDQQNRKRFCGKNCKQFFHAVPYRFGAFTAHRLTMRCNANFVGEGLAPPVCSAYCRIVNSPPAPAEVTRPPVKRAWLCGGSGGRPRHIATRRGVPIANLPQSATKAVPCGTACAMVI